MFTVSLSADDLDSLRRIVREADADPILLTKLYSPRVVKAAPKPRATRAADAPEPFAPNTGDAKLDAFMVAHHNPKRRPLPMPKGPTLPPLKPMKVSEMDAAEAAWKTACEEGAEAVAAGRPSDAEAALRRLIALHRNPWALEATERHLDGSGETRLYTSPRHPGIGIHAVDTTERAAGFVVGRDRRYRVVVNGSSTKDHYRVEDAEAEADALVEAFA